MPKTFDSIDEVQRLLAGEQYFADREIATTVFLAQRLEKPLFLEGEAGVGKTEVAKVLARILNTRLIRLQCYEGLDANHALYEWNYPKQLLRIKMGEAEGAGAEQLGQTIFSEEYLVRRPLLDALTSDGSQPPVLLIDEVDRADEEFEAFLLEILSDFQISIPELGTIRAEHPPFVVLTSNRTRDIHDALKRRCLYLWLAYPTFEREREIVLAKVPGINLRLAEQVCSFMQLIRERDFYKRPGIAETIDWAAALMILHRDALDPAIVEETLGCIFKYNDDITAFREADVPALLEQVVAGSRP
ncbi:MAG TPA: MoxR family ATPase [Dehalococcoidia bacterium]|nr:MoxR family ATPase [Dehalococcoidia bacterium]